ncbi:MAG: cupin domain-containing protein [Candidatus Acidiferrales bacterium]
MRITRFGIAVFAVVVCGSASVPPAPAPEPANVVKPTPLILEKNEGERRVVRPWPGHPDPGETFTIKVDPKNGGSSHMVFFTAEIRPGGAIDAHKHPGSDEILFLESGTARAHLGNSVRVVHAGATIFIPANTWVSVDNIGTDTISLLSIFSAPGFEDLMRAESVREGEKNVPVTKAEDARILRAHRYCVIYANP